MAETELEKARRHVREGEAHVARQRRLVARLRRDGHDSLVGVAQILLGSFEQTLAEHRRHLRIKRDAAPGRS
jgi:hypothetical protein